MLSVVDTNRFINITTKWIRCTCLLFVCVREQYVSAASQKLLSKSFGFATRGQQKTDVVVLKISDSSVWSAFESRIRTEFPFFAHPWCCVNCVLSLVIGVTSSCVTGATIDSARLD